MGRCQEPCRALYISWPKGLSYCQSRNSESQAPAPNYLAILKSRTIWFSTYHASAKCVARGLIAIRVFLTVREKMHRLDPTLLNKHHHQSIQQKGHMPYHLVNDLFRTLKETFLGNRRDNTAPKFLYTLSSECMYWKI